MSTNGAQNLQNNVRKNLEMKSKSLFVGVCVCEFRTISFFSAPMFTLNVSCHINTFHGQEYHL